MKQRFEAARFVGIEKVVGTGEQISIYDFCHVPPSGYVFRRATLSNSDLQQLPKLNTSQALYTSILYYTECTQ